MTTEQHIHEYVGLLECTHRCAEEKLVEAYGRRLCPQCNATIPKFIADLLLAKAQSAPLLTIAKEISLSLKHIVAHIDKLELAQTTFSKDERKNE